MDGDEVCVTTAKMHALARLVNTLLGRAQSSRRVGMNSGMRGSNNGPKPADWAVTHSIADPESPLRSDFIASFRGLDMERIPAIISSGKLQPPILQHSVSWIMLCSI